MNVPKRTERKIGTVMIVDDSPFSIFQLEHILADVFNVEVVDSAKHALSVLDNGFTPDLFLLDVSMPEMDGYKLCKILKSRDATCRIPVIFLTACRSSEEELQGLGLGAVDYIKKPELPAVILAKVQNHMATKLSDDRKHLRMTRLDSVLTDMTTKIGQLQSATLQALVGLAETRDPETGKHILRTQHYIKLLAMQLREHPDFSTTLTDEFINMLGQSAPLHDIGKVGIPDSILLKPGKLTIEEFEVMKTHPTLGCDAIEKAERLLGENAEFLQIAKEIVYGHHEKWDGSGYPQGIAGDQIPVSARLMAMVDVYDALTSVRPYKTAMSHAQATDLIIRSKGSHFDPRVVDAYLEVQPQFQKIAAEHGDDETSCAA